MKKQEEKKQNKKSEKVNHPQNPLRLACQNRGCREVKKYLRRVRTMAYSFMIALAYPTINISRMFNVLW